MIISDLALIYFAISSATVSALFRQAF